MVKKLSEQYPEVFHYTGAAGLAGIVSSGSLWATHVDFLNDQEEYRLFFTTRLPMLLRRAVGIAFARVRDRPKVREFVTKFGGEPAAKEHWVSELMPIFADGTRDINEPYVASFCGSSSPRISAHGLLSQWRGYGRDGGYAIVFNTTKLEELWPRDAELICGMPMFWGDVEYFDDPGIDAGEHDETREDTDKVVGCIAAFLLSQDSGDLDPMFDVIHRLACLTKHWGFKEEHEVRMVISQPSEKLRRMAPEEFKLKPIHHVLRDGVPVPYMALLENVGEGARGRLPIERVIVGPHPDRLARKVAVEVLLLQHGYLAPVHVSEIPYRRR